MNTTTKLGRYSFVMLLGVALVLSTGLTGCLEPSPGSDPDPELVLECGQEALYSYEHNVCEPMAAVGDNACWCAIGFAWDGSECVMVTGCECAGPDCDSLASTQEECVAAHAACLVSGSGLDDPPAADPEPEPDPEPAAPEPESEAPADFSCGSPVLFSVEHDGCGPMDAAGDGACYCFLGFVWNGEECVGVGGCECLGADCDSLTHTMEECLAAHVSCGV